LTTSVSLSTPHQWFSFTRLNVLDAVIMLVGTATLLALILVFSLSLRLREREIDVIFKLGWSRATIARLLGAEILINILFSSAVCAVLLSFVVHYDQLLVRNLFIKKTFQGEQIPCLSD